MRRARLNRRKPKPRQLPKLPPLPRVRINWRRVVSVPLALGLAVAASLVVRDLIDRPVRSLVVEGTLQRVTTAEIEAAVKPLLSPSFLRMDLQQVHAAVAAIDWVDQVRLQRIWPDQLKISFTEHRAAASWGDSGLLNTRGELFAENVRHEYQDLPKLAGPEGSHRRVAAVYLNVRDRLANFGLQLDGIRMDARGAFHITLTSEQTIRVGRSDIAQRIERLFDVALVELEHELDAIDYIDLRYPNGFAVGRRETATARTELARLGDG